MPTHTYFTLEQEKWLRDNYHDATSYADLTEKFNAVFGAERNVGMVKEKCNKRMGLTGMPNQGWYSQSKGRPQLPVGTMRKSGRFTYIKVADSANKGCSGYEEPYWLPLQKKIYQDAFGEITPGKIVCFLDGDTENFDLDNLYPVEKRITAIMARNKWWTDSKEQTLTAIKWCELFYAIKEVNSHD